MRVWTAWALTGIAITLAIVVATCLLGLARISPRIGRWMARSALAVVALRFSFQMIAGILMPQRD